MDPMTLLMTALAGSFCMHDCDLEAPAVLAVDGHEQLVLSLDDRQHFLVAIEPGEPDQLFLALRNERAVGEASCVVASRALECAGTLHGPDAERVDFTLFLTLERDALTHHQEVR